MISYNNQSIVTLLLAIFLIAHGVICPVRRRPHSFQKYGRGRPMQHLDRCNGGRPRIKLTVKKLVGAQTMTPGEFY